jgi:hypothetical protein
MLEVGVDFMAESGILVAGKRRMQLMPISLGQDALGG